MPRVVMSLLAEDRAGIVNQLSDLALANGANWLESRMACLAGEFAGVVLLEVPEDGLEALVAALKAFEAAQVLVSVGSPGGEDQDAQHLEISLDGADHPGIVHELSALLSERGINIVEMETDQHPAAMSGQPIFTAELHVMVPPDCDRGSLASAIDDLAEQLTVDIRLG